MASNTTSARRAPSGPDTTSGDYDAMAPYWTKSQTILDGIDALSEVEEYLPQFPAETDANYEYRRTNAKLTNIFRDICETLAAKPFAQECKLAREADVPARLKELSFDVDGKGNSLHVFASGLFFRGIAKAIDWILVDYTRVPAGVTQAEERALGARPYWCEVQAENLLAVYSDMINGREEIVHARIFEPSVERVEFTEVAVERVRVFDRPRTDTIDVATGLPSRTYGAATFTLYEKEIIESRRGRQPKINWSIVEAGPISIGIIPLIPFMTGRRRQRSWQLMPPLQDCADLQIEHYQAETNLKNAKERTCFPMIAGNGITPERDKNDAPKQVPTGPSAVLYAPMGEDGNHGEWTVLEPAASSLQFLADDVKETGKQLRELGRQPLTADTGNLTVVTTAFAAQKGNSAVQAWALGLKDALERAWEITCLWLGEATVPEVFVFTDFGIDTDDGSSMERVIEMRKNGDLTRETMWEEAQRRNELAADFDAEDEQKRLSEEGPDPLSTEDLLAAARTGKKPPGKQPVLQ